MSRSEARRQKQLAKKKAKRSAKRNEVQRERSLSISHRIAAPGGDIIDCLIGRRNLMENGIASAACAVRLRTGEIGVVIYLIDRWCLGVKDVFGRIVAVDFYADWADQFRERTGAKSIAPATLRALLDDAVAFAQSCGQPPHPSYPRYQRVLGRIEPLQARERFEMGHNGKPHFVGGPDDDESRCRHIVARLHEVCGEGNYHYTVPIDNALGDSLFAGLDDDDVEVWEEVEHPSESGDDSGGGDLPSRGSW